MHAGFNTGFRRFYEDTVDWKHATIYFDPIEKG